jgi:GNAT superfamily N-acetyltransferase
MTEVNLAFADRDSHPYRRFAEKRGFALANVEVRRILDLPVDDTVLQAWIDDSAPHHRDYRIETYADDVPDELLPSLVHVVNQLALDAPTGDLEFEAEAMTVEGFKDRRDKIKEMGRTVYETVAIAPDGDVVAHSTLSVSADDPDLCFQWGTLVRRDHRGHRLGMALKAANLRAMQRAHPEQKRIVTTNSEVNAPMVAINEEMGFKPVELLAEFQQVFDEE